MPFPSPEQRMAIEHRGRPLVVVAGPGTGKTQTIVERMISLLRENPSRDVTFVTFTRTSRSDTLAKLNQALPEGWMDQPQVVPPRVGTLHASATAIVRRLAASIGVSPRFSVLVADRGERDLVIQEVIDDLGLRISPQPLADDLLCYFRNLAVAERLHLAEGDFFSAFNHYMALLRFYDSLGMEEIVFNAIQVLQSQPEQAPPTFLQVDEYQDLNSADQRLVSLIAADARSEVVVVGDDAQSIYGFRGANYKGLRALWEAPEWDSLAFPDCHRLPAHVHRAAHALIAAGGYLGSAMNPKPGDGHRVLTLQCTKSNYQGPVLARKIRDFLARHQRADGSPLQYSDVLILCPCGHFVPGIRAALLALGIPSRENARSDIPRDVWKIILIVRFAIQGDNLAFRQWLEYVDIPADEVTEIRRAAMDRNRSIIGYCEAGPNETARTVLQHARHLQERCDTAPELAAGLVCFPGLGLPEAVVTQVISCLLLEDGTLAPRSRWLETLYRKYGVLEEESDPGPEDAVLVTTFHSAKGLEGELVCLTWMNERYMPLAGRDIEEERRLLYVGMTRAKQELIITFHELRDENAGYLRFKAMSPFLRGIARYLSITRITASDLH